MVERRSGSSQTNPIWRGRAPFDVKREGRIQSITTAAEQCWIELQVNPLASLDHARTAISNGTMCTNM